MPLRFSFPVAALAIALTCSAADSPLGAATGFWDAYARGDVQSAASQWEGERAGRFRAAHQREVELRCTRVLTAQLRVTELTAARATVDVDALVERVHVDEEHYAVELRMTGAGWKVAGFERREQSFAAELLRASNREALLDQHGPLVTTRLAAALGRRAILLNSRQRHEEAAAVLALARDVADRTASDAARAFVLAAESVHVRRTADDPADSIPVATEAERLALRSGDADALGEARVRLARALETADPPRAEALLLQVVDAADAMDDPVPVAMAASQLAWMAGARLEHARSFRFSLLASRYAQLSGDPSARLNAALNLAGAYDSSGDPELTRLHYERAASVARESGAVDAELFALTKLAMLAAEFDPGREPDVLSAAREVAECMGPRGVESSLPLFNISAMAALQRNDLAAARRELDAALSLRPRSAAPVAFDAALHVTEARILIAEGKPMEALLALEEARGLMAEHTDEGIYEHGFSYAHAQALLALGRRGEAISTLREGIAIIERKRASLPVNPLARQSFFVRRMRLYDALVALLAEAGRNAEALEVTEQRTARTLHEFAGATAAAPRRAPPEVVRAERAVVELNRAILAARSGDPSLHAVRERLAAARLQLDDLRVQHAAEEEAAAPVTLELEKVAPRTAIVRYVVAGDRTLAFVVTRRGLTARPLPIGVRELSERIEALLKRIRARDANYRKVARSLHALLVAPLLPDLDGVERVAVVPDGPLWSLPFQTLLDARGVPLLSRFELRYAPSVSWCLRDSATARKPDSILAVGDPEIGGAGQAMFRSLVPGATLGQLPDAAREAREVGRLYPRSRVLTGRAADEAALKEEIVRYDVVHLATHALIDEAQPLYSSLVLASRNVQDDGLLEARELQSLDLDAELVVLSACSTARGRSYGGEGVVGLAWALLSRGVPRVVVSQWNADSKATTKLMVSFHRFLVAGNTPAAALRKAQLELRKDVRYEDPLYWAAFVVVGEG
ncbi:MAG TPA: CHAT domain-containing protein [Thermoanaerobaculia bacterium]|jgi:CHAT domain-containing protein